MRDKNRGESEGTKHTSERQAAYPPRDKDITAPKHIRELKGEIRRRALRQESGLFQGLGACLPLSWTLLP